ncbi:hypothetical protein A5699_18075 [Mycobacterium sp. E802]|uniref:sensor domain-containing protein n=1 Tax=Mycobacterium sp. E802 TaxID=1834152 RepID=UPI0007FBBA30|nr:sensor domain-containing protein [Mycobacterium sp. E802]OBG88122.1 hypothetical protein A5699_18075 [Mycobacterium sp. E802]
MPRTRAWCAVAATAALIGLTGCTSTVSGTALPRTPPPEENKLDQIMVPIEQLKTIVGAGNLVLTSKTADMNDNFGKVRDEKCLGALYPAEDMDYLFSYWTAVRNQVAQDPDSGHRHWVQQSAILFASEDEARSSLKISTKVWNKCNGATIPIHEGQTEQTWHIRDLIVEKDVIKQTSTRAGGEGWTCQHALSIVGKISVEAKVCGYSVRDEAATIVDKLVANAR